MPRVLKLILFLILFGIFFEAGLISSYTIVTQQPPDIGGLLNTQLETVSAIFKSLNINSNILGSPDNLTVLNVDEVAAALQTKVKIDGINIPTLSASTYQGADNNGMITVLITANGYKDVTTNSGGQIVITPGEKYSITAIAKAEEREKGVEVDVDTIKITSVQRIYAS